VEVGLLLVQTIVLDALTNRTVDGGEVWQARDLRDGELDHATSFELYQRRREERKHCENVLRREKEREKEVCLVSLKVDRRPR